MLAKLETLPWLVLSRICEYLDDDDTDAANQRRSDLRAFSLTSRHCCAVAASQRFCQVRVIVANPDDLMHVLEGWAEMLDRDGGRYRYVQRLKVIPPYPRQGRRRLGGARLRAMAFRHAPFLPPVDKVNRTA
jgi:hypothetical protein